MCEIRHAKMEELEPRRREHGDFAYERRDFVPRGAAEGTLVSIYTLPPLKSAYPYHYHLKDEETFFILRGEGILKTPQGERRVTAGDLLFFPAGSAGAHKLTNASGTEPLAYIDFDTIHDLDVALYPDSGKVGIWGKDINRVYRLDDDRDYYEGE